MSQFCFTTEYLAQITLRLYSCKLFYSIVIGLHCIAYYSILDWWVELFPTELNTVFHLHVVGLVRSNYIFCCSQIDSLKWLSWLPTVFRAVYTARPNIHVTILSKSNFLLRDCLRNPANDWKSSNWLPDWWHTHTHEQITSENFRIASLLCNQCMGSSRELTHRLAMFQFVRRLQLPIFLGQSLANQRAAARLTWPILRGQRARGAEMTFLVRIINTNCNRFVWFWYTVNINRFQFVNIVYALRRVSGVWLLFNFWTPDPPSCLFWITLCIKMASFDHFRSAVKYISARMHSFEPITRRWSLTDIAAWILPPVCHVRFVDNQHPQAHLFASNGDCGPTVPACDVLRTD